MTEHYCPKWHEHYCGPTTKRFNDSHYISDYEYEGKISQVIHGGIYGDQWVEITHCPWCGSKL